MRRLGDHRRAIASMLALAAIGMATALYIVNKQRLRVPLLEPAPFVLKGEFTSGQGVMPGQGQTVRVSGVRIGDITGVDLHEGRAVLTFEIEPEFEGLVRRNWHGLLRPKTGLKDMFVELIPRPEDAPPAPHGHTLPVANTLPDVNADEILAAMDADTRDYFRLLLSGAAEGLRGRSDDLRAVFRRVGPTYRDLGRYTSAVAQRREELRRLISALGALNTELGRQDDSLAKLVSSASRVFGTYALEERNVAALVRELPGALKQTTRTMGRVETLGRVLQSAPDRIRPAVRALQRSNEATTPFAREVAPLLRRDIRPFVREAGPVLRSLVAPSRDLVAGEPGLKRTVRVLNRLFNMLAHNPGGREGPAKRDRDEGYLFYSAWLPHQSVNVFSGGDAHGVFRPLVLGGTCNTIRGTLQSTPDPDAAAFLAGLTSAFEDPRVCGADALEPGAGDGAASRREEGR